MEIDLENLDKQYEILAMDVMMEYYDAIDALMIKNQSAILSNLTPKDGLNKEILKLAEKETATHMKKYGLIFFDSEIERLLDGFNNKEYEVDEFNIRCTVLTGIKNSLIDFHSKEEE